MTRFAHQATLILGALSSGVFAAPTSIPHESTALQSSDDPLIGDLQPRAVVNVLEARDPMISKLFNAVTTGKAYEFLESFQFRQDRASDKQDSFKQIKKDFLALKGEVSEVMLSWFSRLPRSRISREDREGSEQGSRPQPEEGFEEGPRPQEGSDQGHRSQEGPEFPSAEYQRILAGYKAQLERIKNLKGHGQKRKYQGLQLAVEDAIRQVEGYLQSYEASARRHDSRNVVNL
ncbi:hypothetical protein EV361DRAFT_864521 [Lentinula raphanica]|nr:hypothetical protein EV361DRAFT_864521 [Lentinula raphanica]